MEQRILPWQKRLASWAGGFATALAAAILLVLGIGTFFTLPYRANMDFFEDVSLSQARNPVSVVVWAVALALLFLVLLVLLSHRWRWRSARVVTAGVALLHTGFALWWCNSIVYHITADPVYVRSLALNFAYGEPVAEVNYLRAWPHQGSMALNMALIYRLFGDETRNVAMVQTLFAGVCVLALCGICGQITQKPAAQGSCALLCLLFIGAPLYSSFIYGTLPSMALAFVGCYGVVRLCRGGKAWWWLLPVLCFPEAYALYSQGIIFAVAAAVALVFTAVIQGKAWPRWAVPAAAMVAGCFVFNGILTNIALDKAELPQGTGVPYSANLMMGITADRYKAPGFFDNSNYELYYANDEDHDATAQAAKEIIAQAVEKYLKDPASAADFFWRKTVYQWMDPWFESLIANNPAVIYEDAGWLPRALTVGHLYGVARGILGALLPVVYLFAAVGLVAIYRSAKALVWQLLPAICFLGGFLFQFVWETKPRYCMPYYYMLFPLAAAGLVAVAGWLAQKIPAKKRAGAL